MTKEKLVRTDRRGNMTKLFILFLSLIARIPGKNAENADFRSGSEPPEGRGAPLPHQAASLRGCCAFPGKRNYLPSSASQGSGTFVLYFMYLLKREVLCCFFFYCRKPISTVFILNLLSTCNVYPLAKEVKVSRLLCRASKCLLRLYF